MVSARIVMGDADAVGEQVQQLMAMGLDGITANMPANGHDPEAVAEPPPVSWCYLAPVCGRAEVGVTPGFVS